MRPRTKLPETRKVKPANATWYSAWLRYCMHGPCCFLYEAPNFHPAKSKPLNRLWPNLVGRISTLAKCWWRSAEPKGLGNRVTSHPSVTLYFFLFTRMQAQTERPIVAVADSNDASWWQEVPFPQFSHIKLAFGFTVPQKRGSFTRIENFTA